MTVSVITPIYNGEIYLEKFIKSIKKNTFKDTEYIFIDNNSTDNTVFFLKNLLESTNLSYKILKENRQGAGFARNTGINYAKGDYLIFLDIDDSINPEKIAYDFKIMKENNVDFVFCRALRFYEDGREIKHPIDGIKSGINNPPNLGIIWLKHFFYLQGPGSMFVKKQIVLELGGFHTSRTGEDAFMFIKMGLLYKGYFYDKTFFNYFRHSKSTISSVNLIENGTLLSYFNIRKDLFIDTVIQNNSLSKSIVSKQLQVDILRLNKEGYKIQGLLQDDKLELLKLDFIIFNKLSLLINKMVSKIYYNPFYRLWLKRQMF